MAALVNDPTPQDKGLAPMAGRNEDLYFHTKASDQQSPYKEFLAKTARPELCRSALRLALQPGESGPPVAAGDSLPPRPAAHRLGRDRRLARPDARPPTACPTASTPCPTRITSTPLYLTTGGSELWRLPGPRRAARRTTGRASPRPRPRPARSPAPSTWSSARATTYIYELAIPKEELAQLKLAAGTTLGVMLRAGNNSGPHVDFGADKAVTKKNGLTLHPYWERSQQLRRPLETGGVVGGGRGQVVQSSKVPAWGYLIVSGRWAGTFEL